MRLPGQETRLSRGHRAGSFPAVPTNHAHVPDAGYEPVTRKWR
jgi:hypothetical protein